MKDRQITGVIYDDGEVVPCAEPVQVVRETELAQKREYFKKKEEKEVAQYAKEKAMAEQKNDFGGFVLTVNEAQTPMLTDITPSFLTMLIYLVTYMNYDGYLVDTRYHPITRDRLRFVLEISDVYAKQFWDAVNEAGLITEKNGLLYPSPQYFTRKRLEPQYVGICLANGKCIGRLYINGIRDIWEHNCGVGIKRLGYVFRMLPFVNKEYNIVCWNPDETDITKIKRLTMGEFAQEIGLDVSHINRLVKDLFNVVFWIGGKERRLIHYVVADGLNADTWGIYVNPRVYYAGQHHQEVEILGAFDK